jgi:hypothetical protein
MGRTLLSLIDNPDYREEKGRRMRAWLVRNHGEARTTPLMLALLRLTADNVALPRDLVSPLQRALQPEEIDYHAGCQKAA